MQQGNFHNELKRVLVEKSQRYRPLEIRSATVLAERNGVEGQMKLAWAERKVEFIFRGVPRSAPSVAKPIIDDLDSIEIAGTHRSYPLVVAPYLSESLYRELERRRISGLDLNGNFCIFADELLALRLDRANEYTEERDIKGIYSRNSSIVGRLFLTEPKTYEAVGEVHGAIQKRGGEISLSTVSKVLNGLADEMMIEKERGSIRLLQPEALLDKLREGYVEPRVTEDVPLQREDLTPDLLRARLGGDWVWSGSTSAHEYAVTTPDSQPVLYTKPERIDELADLREERFYSCTARATDDSFVYFDAREGTSSPIQAYLELSQGGKRDREIAEEIRKVILRPFRQRES